ncbi:WcaF family extracellular polysaccharide biosynthesis acetyltransferase [Rhodopirellula europaea]|uniref:WcaF family extracellular polysaccharide biosynthesis acetyltransferase n=1 Tax=Rhodopirellula europaea TaxID=1263866 RepID=UPI000A2F7F40|nr:WcaF family extracellular polysaccharide biosynthesis acetyltransferase [Rhodopirellula europaea]
MIDLAKFNNDGFDRGASRLKELAWVTCRLFFFLLPIPLPSKIRVLLLRLFGATIGKGVVIRSGVSISFPWRLSIGDHVWIGEGVSILSLDQVTIESNCCASQDAFLCTGSHDFSKSTFDLITRPIVVREGAWVAARCFVAPGVTVGPGSMCAAGSVVLKDVPPHTTVLGNPAMPRQTR